MKVFQYLPMAAAKSVLNPNQSTFQLKALRCFRAMERDSKGVGDPEELVAHYSSGGTSELLNDVLVSCWSAPSDDSHPKPDWEGMNNEEWRVAILSTTELVHSHISQLLANMFAFPPRIDHHGVCYGRKAEELPDKGTHIFSKPREYSHQTEYRFAVWMSSSISPIDVLLLSSRDPESLPSYILEVHFRDNVTEREKFDVLEQIGRAHV